MKEELLIEKLTSIEQRYAALTEELGDPSVVGNPRRYQQIARTHSELGTIVSAFSRYRQLRSAIADTRSVLEDSASDRELRAMAQEEISTLEAQAETSRQDLSVMLLPRDPNDHRNVVLEIRAGTGGDEASIFASDLFRMYSRYAERRHWRVELLSSSPTGVGGYKEIIALLEGDGAFSRLKFESGVHRVQRVPATETSGRKHTSAVTVAVLPEADEVEVLCFSTLCFGTPCFLWW
jgi:peptide chain release factor 1